VHLAGWSVLSAVEKDPFACVNYRLNFPSIGLFEGDIADFLPASRKTKADQLDTLVGADSVDLLFGGPPCQGYSQIGPRDVGDPRNEMYLHALRLAEVLRPRYILLENVPNMLMMRRGLFRDRIIAALKRAGYDNYVIRTLDASKFGVPQARKRVFIAAAKSKEVSVPLEHAFDLTCASLTEKLVSVDQAIDDLPKEIVESGEVIPYPSSARPSSFQREMRLGCTGKLYTRSLKRAMYRNSGDSVTNLHNHHTKDIQERRLRLIKLLKPGKKADSLPKDVWDNARPEKWRRFNGAVPAHTLMAQMHRDLSEWVHPRWHRWITVREALRLQSFHDGFVLRSSEWQQLKQVGNAVPPLLARIPALALRLAEAMQEGEELPFQPKKGQGSLFAHRAHSGGR